MSCLKANNQGQLPVITKSKGSKEGSGCLSLSSPINSSHLQEGIMAIAVLNAAAAPISA